MTKCELIFRENVIFYFMTGELKILSGNLPLGIPYLKKKQEVLFGEGERARPRILSDFILTTPL